MLHIIIPPARTLILEHLCLDLNGTICFDKQLIAGVEDQLTTLAMHLQIHVITADTNDNAARLLHNLPLTLHCIEPEEQGRKKLEYIQQLKPQSCICMGNGFNDRFMLEQAGLGIAILGREGLACSVLQTADIAISNIIDAFDLLIYPERLIATLRD